MSRDAGESRLIVGLMSGTSADGIDAALVEVRGAGFETTWQLIAFETTPYPPELREAILRVCRPESSDVRQICELNFQLGSHFAQAVKQVARKAGVPLEAITLVGSHGQTIYHQPPSAQAGTPSTLQIGEPAVIAQETGIPTIADFRVADMAVGGEGAPLVPYVDFLLFHQPGRVRALQNIGGIANVTYLPDRPEGVIAFDTGPGNVLIDGAMRQLTGEPMDRDGAFAATGQVHSELRAFLKRHPFLNLSPPKSTGREAFGEAYLGEVLDRARQMRVSAPDTLATLTAFTAECIFDSYRRFLEPSPQEIFVSGGGAHNRTLMRHLQRLFEPTPVQTVEALGCPIEAKEALAFAILANETLAGRPGNLPQVTGAQRAVVLGKFVPSTRPVKFGVQSADR